MDNVLISVIVPCYNQAQYLDECLQSVLDQTYQDWECIIVNDGSPDNTAEVAKKWLEKDVRFKYYYKENGGLSSARNFGIDKAEGEWILPLDSDDYISKDYLDLAKSHFVNQDLNVIYCEAQKFGAVNEKWELEEFTLTKLALENLIFCSAFFRKADWRKVSGYDENLVHGLEDWDFWISLLKDGGKVLKLQEICFFYRIKEKSMLQDLKESKSIFPIMYIESKHINFFHQQLGTFNKISKLNRQHEELIDILIHKRKFSRFVNQIYSLFESKLFKYKM
ncbi:glycosyltransferase family 2 protein [Chryseobacterium sp. SNU WT5]|uniref:glycosyltransferase family 2 protein n=1 Tax=Chryseobacterium sp. SNU WT5 TaxID=2594269 RepID=UPI0011816971|nr:glycosyltransferase family A protein [Chryseobacterium sp. SNU WT5]QDP85812.1 glycosyltransferase family 2 protein [Chryseobacterium sp. SNU WT5]